MTTFKTKQPPNRTCIKIAETYEIEREITYSIDTIPIGGGYIGWSFIQRGGFFKSNLFTNKTEIFEHIKSLVKDGTIIQSVYDDLYKQIEIWTDWFTDNYNFNNNKYTFNSKPF